jgi:hypothetical protein
MHDGGTTTQPGNPLPEGMVERVLACPAVRAEAVARVRVEMALAGWPRTEELAAALVGSLIAARHA